MDTPSPNPNPLPPRRTPSHGGYPTPSTGPQKLIDYLKFREAMDALQSDFDTLRVQTKYLVFDLEATRREKNELLAGMDRACAELDQCQRAIDRKDQVIALLRMRLRNLGAE